MSELEPDEVHVWWVELGRPTASDLDVLDEAEHARARRFRFERHRERFILAHAALRRILAPHVGVSPAALAFEHGQRGKPCLRDDPALAFNLSHSGELALVALTRGASLGVDVEREHPLESWRAIAVRYFSAREVAAIDALDAPVRERAFFRCWTRKEAFIKALGLGLAYPLERFDVSLAPGEPARLEAIRDPVEAARGWTLHDLAAPAGYAAALAVEGQRRLQSFRYPGSGGV